MRRILLAGTVLLGCLALGACADGSGGGGPFGGLFGGSAAATDEATTDTVGDAGGTTTDQAGEDVRRPANAPGAGAPMELEPTWDSTDPATLSGGMEGGRRGMPGGT